MALFGRDRGEGVDDVEWVLGKDKTTRTRRSLQPLPLAIKSKVTGADTKKDAEFQLA